MVFCVLSALNNILGKLATNQREHHNLCFDHLKSFMKNNEKHRRRKEGREDLNNKFHCNRKKNHVKLGLESFESLHVWVCLFQLVHVCPGKQSLSVFLPLFLFLPQPRTYSGWGQTAWRVKLHRPKCSPSVEDIFLIKLLEAHLSFDMEAPVKNEGKVGVSRASKKSKRKTKKKKRVKRVEEIISPNGNTHLSFLLKHEDDLRFYHIFIFTCTSKNCLIFFLLLTGWLGGVPKWSGIYAVTVRSVRVINE